eukprot:GEMP01000227.1.p1 GENE.GEMP01000227.1~~GEMP01000227.1.p1  ORF type:complete len:2191 (-),score=454.71 GEMP01000227.1:1562-8134(-)
MFFIGSKYPAKIVKNEIHNLVAALRLTKTRASESTKFHVQAVKAFQALYEELAYINELNDLEALTYLEPFLKVIESEETDGQLTEAALAAVNKFVTFGLIHPSYDHSVQAVNTLAWAVINCRFAASKTHPWTNEVVLLKIMHTLVDCLRCEAGDYLKDECVWRMVKKCYQIAKQPRSSSLLQATAENCLVQLIHTIFADQRTRSQKVLPSRVPLQEVQKPYGYKAMKKSLKFISYLMSYGYGPTAEESKKMPRRPARRSPSPRRVLSPGRSDDDIDLHAFDARNTNEDVERRTEMRKMGLMLLNMALETGGEEVAKSPELIEVIQDDICKYLLQNSRTDSLQVLSIVLRAVFNLFNHFKKHLKVQLEVFFTSIHLKIGGAGARGNLAHMSNNKVMVYEQRELAMESLLEFCREPELMHELYENYDCDVRCTNLFETLVKFLLVTAYPEGEAEQFTSLHKLALNGFLSITKAIALRCDLRPRHSHASFDEAGSEPLKQRKERKKRVLLSAQLFNSDPFKCTTRLQNLGMLQTPLTAEAMAKFLKNTHGLDLRSVGEYLSKRKDFNGEVREAFVKHFDFIGVALVDGLKSFLSTFRLPGEAQLIERLMESFANGYYQSQPLAPGVPQPPDGDPQKMCRVVSREKTATYENLPDNEKYIYMKNGDTIFILSYSIIMLNTDLHNPGVKSKMTADEFCRNNRGIDNGEDLPKFFLVDIYEAIRDDEIRLHGEAVDDGGQDDSWEKTDTQWDGILMKNEVLDEFCLATDELLSQTSPGTVEREMFNIIWESSPIPVLSFCLESRLHDRNEVAEEAARGLFDLAKIGAYFGHVESVNSLARVAAAYFCHRDKKDLQVAPKAEVLSYCLSVKSQLALEQVCKIVQGFGHHLRHAWKDVIGVMLKAWVLGLLGAADFDDFTRLDGKQLPKLCTIVPPYAPTPAADKDTPTQVEAARALSTDENQESLLTALTKWFDDEVENTDVGRRVGSRGSLRRLSLEEERRCKALPWPPPKIPIRHADIMAVHSVLRQYCDETGKLQDLFSCSLLIGKAPPDSLIEFSKALVSLSISWDVDSIPHPDSERMGRILALEVLTNMTCTISLSAGANDEQKVSVVWPLVSTHFDRLLQTKDEDVMFQERVIVNSMRLCIRLGHQPPYVPALISLLKGINSLDESVFNLHAERVACGLGVLGRNCERFERVGQLVIFQLLKRIAELPGNDGAQKAGLSVMTNWLDFSEVDAATEYSVEENLLDVFTAFAMRHHSALQLLSQIAQKAVQRECATRLNETMVIQSFNAMALVAAFSSTSSTKALFEMQQMMLSSEMVAMDFGVWRKLFEEVLFPLLQGTLMYPFDRTGCTGKMHSVRNAAAQLFCRLMLTHMPVFAAHEDFPQVFLRLVLLLAQSHHDQGEQVVESLKNLLLVISSDTSFRSLRIQGQLLLDASWAAAEPLLPGLHEEIKSMFPSPPSSPVARSSIGSGFAAAVMTGDAIYAPHPDDLAPPPSTPTPVPSPYTNSMAPLTAANDAHPQYAAEYNRYPTATPAPAYVSNGSLGHDAPAYYTPSPPSMQSTRADDGIVGGSVPEGGYTPTPPAGDAPPPVCDAQPYQSQPYDTRHTTSMHEAARFSQPPLQPPPVDAQPPPAPPPPVAAQPPATPPPVNARPPPTPPAYHASSDPFSVPPVRVRSPESLRRSLRASARSLTHPWPPASPLSMHSAGYPAPATDTPSASSHQDVPPTSGPHALSPGASFGGAAGLVEQRDELNLRSSSTSLPPDLVSLDAPLVGSDPRLQAHTSISAPQELQGQQGGVEASIGGTFVNPYTMVHASVGMTATGVTDEESHRGVVAQYASIDITPPAPVQNDPTQHAHSLAARPPAEVPWSISTTAFSTVDRTASLDPRATAEDYFQSTQNSSLIQQGHDISKYHSMDSRFTNPVCVPPAAPAAQNAILPPPAVHGGSAQASIASHERAIPPIPPGGGPQHSAPPTAHADPPPPPAPRDPHPSSPAHTPSKTSAPPPPLELDHTPPPTPLPTSPSGDYSSLSPPAIHVSASADAARGMYPTQHPPLPPPSPYRAAAPSPGVASIMSSFGDSHLTPQRTVAERLANLPLPPTNPAVSGRYPPMNPYASTPPPTPPLISPRTYPPGMPPSPAMFSPRPYPPGMVAPPLTSPRTPQPMYNAAGLRVANPVLPPPMLHSYSADFQASYQR